MQTTGQTIHLLMRCFIALDPPLNLRHELAMLVRSAPAGFRAMPEKQIHLTLHFLGDLSAATLAQLSDSLGQVRSPVLTLELTGLGTFPARGRPRVLWEGVAKSRPLERLHARLAESLRSVGLPPEARPFQPHVTLARIGAATPLSWLEDLLRKGQPAGLAPFLATSFTLYESRRAAPGVLHVPLASFRLTRGAVESEP